MLTGYNPAKNSNNNVMKPGLDQRRHRRLTYIVAIQNITHSSQLPRYLQKITTDVIDPNEFRINVILV